MLRKITKVFVLFLSFMSYSNILHAHSERVHQYVAIEAYNLLKLYLGTDVPQILNNMGSRETGNFLSWYDRGNDFDDGKIVAGAFREDVYDLVYNFPDAWGVSLFKEGLREAYASCTHFWEADQGDDAPTNLDFTPALGLPNAYQKIMAYCNGIYIGHACGFQATTLQGITGKIYSVENAPVNMTYYGLIDLYKTGRVFVKIANITTSDGKEITYSGDLFLPEDLKNKIVFEILGRMCHLLTDMSVPAHVHNNAHVVQLGSGDKYEQDLMFVKWDVENFYSYPAISYWDANTVWNKYQNIMYPYVSYDSNPLHFLMYSMNQIADHFSSSSVNGDDSFNSNNLEIQKYFPYGVGPTTITDYKNASVSSLTTIRDATFPHAIRAVAGLLFWFAKETGLIVPFSVNMRYNFDNLEYESREVQYSIVGHTKSIEVPKQVSHNGKLYDFVKWSDEVGSNQRTFTNSANVDVVYKLHHSANEITSLANNGQKKFIRSNDGRLNLVYESNGKLWYETSTDNGSTWQVANDGLPLNDGKDGRSPSITTYNDNTIITYIDAASKKVYVESHIPSFSSKYVSRVLVNPNDYFEASSPVVSINSDRNIIVAWATTTGSIIYGVLLLDPYAWTISVVKDQLGNQLFGSVKGSYASSNPSLESNLLDNTKVFHLVWQDGTTNIKYTKLTATCTNGSYSLANSTIQTPSQNSGMDLNSEPCVTALNNGTARIVWKGGFEDMNFAIFMDPTNPSNSTYWMFGNDISSPVINAGSETYYIGWTENQSGNFLTKVTGSSTLSSIKTLDNLFGENIQMNGNGLRSQMYVTSLNTPAGLPYKITQSSAITSILKESKSMTGSGNVAFLTKDSTVTYYCALGDISSDGKQIDFSEKSDTVKLANFNNLNKCLVSEPFILSNTSKINYTITSGIIAHGSNHLSLKNNEHVTFTVELIDETSQEVISSLGKVSFDSINQNISNNALSYEVNTQGLGNVTARLRLNVYDNIKPLYSLAHRFATGTALNKISDNKSIEINLLSNSVISEYKLNQNYPNPFNPSTVINYQIPKSARVSLKVYDLLGKEVASLVNGIKEAGNYNVQFNAGDLPSGLYIYELRADDFVSCKKLLLVK
ncbi:MAG: T9SS type A sorting domain-containing protein [Bacteroidota bacterium]|nr:T9SS type A sorting domain-containing protein [Bacteroidota bacterium]